MGHEELASFQEALLKSEAAVSGPSMAVLPRLWLLQGRPYPADTAFVPYAWNPLDVLCLHRRPIDVVVIDVAGSVGFQPEWTIIEVVRQPRWVILHNVNLPHQMGGW